MLIDIRRAIDKEKHKEQINRLMPKIFHQFIKKEVKSGGFTFFSLEQAMTNAMTGVLVDTPQ